jgi:hypothetical protein
LLFFGVINLLLQLLNRNLVIILELVKETIQDGLIGTISLWYTLLLIRVSVSTLPKEVSKRTREVLVVVGCGTGELVE